MSICFTRRRTVRVGFTVVELLVVIAIIGVLVSILLPAVGAVRDSARRTENQNNLKQIGLAVQMYDEGKQTYPPLIRFYSDAPDLSKSVSWAFEILPFLEQENIYNQLQPAQPVFHPVNQLAMGTPVATYANPRKRDAMATAPFFGGSSMDVDTPKGAILDYAANGGVVVNNGEPITLPVDPASVDPDFPYEQRFDPRFSGPFHPRMAVSSAAVRDGASNTLCAGDRWIGPPVPTSGAGVLNDLCGMAGSSRQTIVRYANVGDNANLPFPSSKADPSLYKFGSPKGSDACFVFLDAHVRWIDYDVNKRVFFALASINDGTPIPAEY